MVGVCGREGGFRIVALFEISINFNFLVSESSGWLNTGRRKLKLKRRAKSLELLSLKKRKIYQGFSDVLLGLGNLKQQTNKQTTNK